MTRALLAAAMIVLGGCGAATQPNASAPSPASTGPMAPPTSSPQPAPESTAAPPTTIGLEPSTPAPTEPAERPNLTLHVSNQSFADDPVEIVVTIDGTEVVRDTFFVESQHNWITFELAVAPGRHELSMTSSTGVRQTATLEMPADAHRWAVVDYWYYPPDPDQPGSGTTPRSFTFSVDDEPMYFA